MAAVAAIVPAVVTPVAITAITALFDHTKPAITAIFDHSGAAIGPAIDAICGALAALPIAQVRDTVSAAPDRVGAALGAAIDRFGGALGAVIDRFGGALSAARGAAIDSFYAAFGSGGGAILAPHVFGSGLGLAGKLGAAHHIGAETALVGTLLDRFGAFSPFRTRPRGSALLLLLLPGNALLLLRPGLLLRLLARRAGITAHLLLALGTHLLRLGAGAFTVLGLGCGGGHCQGKHKGKSRKRAALGKQGVGHKGLLCRPPTTSG
jgi:hypothetical protein